MSWTGEIVGHRGAAGVAPENTLASFEEAIAAGAHRIEFDVRRTLDGHAVVFHDFSLERFVAGADRRGVSRHPLAELRALDVGAALGRPGCFVPSLQETLEALGGRVLLNLEVKGSGSDGLLVLRLSIEALRRHGLGASTVISSFHAPVLRAAEAIAPEIPRAFIFDMRVAGDPVAIARASRCEAVHPHQRLADGRMLERCRKAGLLLRAWTANEEPDILRLMDLGADGIVSDFPERVRRLRDTMPAP